MVLGLSHFAIPAPVLVLDWAPLGQRSWRAALVVALGAPPMSDGPCSGAESSCLTDLTTGGALASEGHLLTVGHFLTERQMARRQQEKSAQTQQEILEAAERLFVEKGYLATTVQEITEAAGYAKGNFYRYWSSKEELMLEIIASKMRQYRAMRDAELGAAKSLAEVMDAILDFLEQMHADRGWSLVFLEFTIAAARKPELRARLSESHYRLSNEIFAALVGPHLPSGCDGRLMGALNTALFEGFLIHELVGGGELQLKDFRRAARKLALECQELQRCPDQDPSPSSLNPSGNPPEESAKEVP